MCRNETEVYTWLASFFNDENFSLDKPITQESVNESLLEGAPVLVPINGYDVAIMFGEDSVYRIILIGSYMPTFSSRCNCGSQKSANTIMLKSFFCFNLKI